MFLQSLLVVILVGISVGISPTLLYRRKKRYTPLTQRSTETIQQGMKFRPGYLKPTIKSLSGKRRNWAKVHKFYLTGRNRITADLLIRELKRMEV